VYQSKTRKPHTKFEPRCCHKISMDILTIPHMGSSGRSTHRQRSIQADYTVLWLEYISKSWADGHGRRPHRIPVRAGELLGERYQLLSLMIIALLLLRETREKSQ
jgi:hypothetical protein